MLAVFYYSLIATMSNIQDPEHFGWFIALCIGWAGIAVTGFAIQRKFYKNLLVPPGGGKSKRKIYDALNFSQGQSMDLSKDQSHLDINSPSGKVAPAAFSIDDDEQEESPSPSSGSASQSVSATPSSEIQNPSPNEAGTIQEDEEEHKSEDSSSDSSSSDRNSDREEEGINVENV